MVDLELIEAVFVRLNIVVLTLALVFSIVAVQGFRGTPWGAVLRPLPIVAGGFLASVFISSLPIGTGSTMSLVAFSWAVAIAAMCWAAIEYWRLRAAGGWRP